MITNGQWCGNEGRIHFDTEGELNTVHTRLSIKGRRRTRQFKVVRGILDSNGHSDQLIAVKVSSELMSNLDLVVVGQLDIHLRKVVLADPRSEKGRRWR